MSGSENRSKRAFCNKRCALTTAFFIIFVLLVCGGVFIYSYYSSTKLQEHVVTLATKVKVLGDNSKAITEKLKSLSAKPISVNGSTIEMYLKPVLEGIQQNAQESIRSQNTKISECLIKTQENEKSGTVTWQLALGALLMSGLSLVMTITQVCVICCIRAMKKKSQP